MKLLLLPLLLISCGGMPDFNVIKLELKGANVEKTLDTINFVLNKNKFMVQDHEESKTLEAHRSIIDLVSGSDTREKVEKSREMLVNMAIYNDALYVKVAIIRNILTVTRDTKDKSVRNINKIKEDRVKESKTGLEELKINSDESRYLSELLDNFSRLMNIENKIEYLKESDLSDPLKELLIGIYQKGQ